MGNLTTRIGSESEESRISRNNEAKGPHRWPSMFLTWDDFQSRRVTSDPEMTVNGLRFFDICLPESVIELILSYINPQDILNCNLVCRNWKDIIIRKSYWKKWFIRNKWDWSIIPAHIKEKPEGWIVLHAQVLKEFCTKNFILNHSGAGQFSFDNWNRFRDGGDGWRVEQPPKGCDPLPDDPFFDNINSAFATSYQTCSKWTQIDLWDMGLTPPVMKTCLPFELVCSQMYTVRFDCGGIFNWTLRILDKDSELIMEYTNTYTLQAQMNWENVEYAFQFKEEHADKMDEVRYLMFSHEGKDSQFWKGHYGPKFARSCVRFRFKQPEVQTASLSESQ